MKGYVFIHAGSDVNVRGFFSRAPKVVDVDKIQELESELDSTRTVLEFTKSSVRTNLEKCITNFPLVTS